MKQSLDRTLDDDNVLVLMSVDLTLISQGTSEFTVNALNTSLEIIHKVSSYLYSSNVTAIGRELNTG